MAFWSNRILSNLEGKFSEVYLQNLFGGAESRSGRGSDSDQTLVLRMKLPSLFRKLEVSTVLDLPCGDFNWMRNVDLKGLSYTGADIVPGLVEKLTQKFAGSGKSFIVLDPVRDELPTLFDAIFCRDLLVHLSTKEILAVLRHFKSSGSKYLLTTHFTGDRKYRDLKFFSRGIEWRPLNLTMDPFRFPNPIEILNERCTEGNGAFTDKSIAVWLLDEIKC
jgi:SAM-dependent methyltransferase